MRWQIIGQNELRGAVVPELSGKITEGESYANKTKREIHMSRQVFIDAYSKMFALHERATTAGNAGLYDAAAFYMRKILEVVADSFLTNYVQMGQAWRFDQFCKSLYYRNPSLDNKIDFLLSQSNIPLRSKNTYDAIRKYGNAAVHKTDFSENPHQHAAMMNLLAVELNEFYIMAMQ
jgi:hypothetical protein